MTMVITEMSVSVDGYVAGPDGDFSWGVPDEELHRFHNDQVRPLGAHVLGRRLYETMSYWETADDPDPVSQDFAAIWKALPKLVFSRTLTNVAGLNTRLATKDLAIELEGCWNQLRALHAFPLLCGYHLAAHETAGAICDCHDLVVSA